MADVDNRVVVAERERAGKSGLPPGGAGAVLPDRPLVVGVPPAALFNVGHVLRCFHELVELADRHLVRAQIERPRERDRVLPLVVLAAGFRDRRTHRE